MIAWSCKRGIKQTSFASCLLHVGLLTVIECSGQRRLQRRARSVVYVCSECGRQAGVEPTVCSQARTCFIHRLLGWNRCLHRRLLSRVRCRRHLRRWLQARWSVLPLQVVRLFQLAVLRYWRGLLRRLLLSQFLNKEDSTKRHCTATATKRKLFKLHRKRSGQLHLACWEEAYCSVTAVA